MSDFFDRALHFLGQHSTNTFVLNIGAMDGIMFDEMYGYTAMYNFKGLYVEPIPYLFEKLKNNVPLNGNLFENCAIAEYDGEIEMIMIDHKVIDEGLVHQCFYGMSAVYPPKNGLGSEGDRATVEKYGQRVKVKCMTLESLLNKHQITTIDVFKVDAEGYDYKIFKQLDLVKFKPKVVRLEWVNLSKEDQADIINTFDKHNYVYDIAFDITAISNELYQQLKAIPKSIPRVESKTEPLNSNITLVTGLWDIKRSELEGSWARSYKDYLDQFVKLLEVSNNMIIFGDVQLEAVVWKKRKHSNTLFIRRNLDWFKQNDYYNLIQKIRTNPNWYSQADWLKTSPQAKLEMYNPIVMSKMFLLNDARILDKFNSTYIFWIDAGLTFTVHPGYFTHDKVLDKLPKYVSNFTFVAFPYIANEEIHGFAFKKICQYATREVNKVARGGFFGGPTQIIQQINGIYYHLLMETLSNGYMGTEESIFSIMMCKYPNVVSYVEIEENGLLWRFFEDLKDQKVEVKYLM